MITVENSGRLCFPQEIRGISNLDFDKEVRLFLKTKGKTHYIFLSNDPDLNLPCFGIAKFDEKFRFYIPKDLRKYLDISDGSPFLVYSLKGQAIFQKL